MLLAFLMTLLPQDPVPGIDRSLAKERAAQLRDVEYFLRLRITAGSSEVQCTTMVRFWLPERREAVAPLVIDWDGPEPTDMQLNSRTTVVRKVHDHLLLPPDRLNDGVNVFSATVTSRVAPTGTPLTVYRDPADGSEYWYTLVVPADAHRLYPCFDQPDVRAVFHLELDLPRDWTAVANTAREVVEDPPRDVAGVFWRFAPTKPLPTYLAAFACGPFATLEAPQPDAPGITSHEPMRMLLRRSQLPRAERDTLVRLHRDGLAWLAQQFDVPYAFDKLDVVLLPGFPYGGMEHAGAIFYRESALVFDHAPTAAERVRRSTLVYHELSHQWFGNLVTMRWFDDLWLKEGFATFVGYQAMAALEPEQQPWLRFGQRVKPRAYEIDSTPGTTPIFQELQNLADAKSAYGAIVYNKAPAVLRALHERLGDEAFRAGLKQYLTKHALGNAEWRDLAAALENASRVDLRRWSQRWLLTPAMPQVRVQWQVDGNGVVTEAAVVQKPTSGEGTWPLDLEVLVFDADGSTRLLRVQGDAARMDLEQLRGKAAPLAVLCNPRDIAYGQFVPDKKLTAFLLAALPKQDDAQVRAAGTQALLEAVREAELDPALFADLALTLLAGERDADTHSALLDQLGPVLERYLPPDRCAPLLARAKDVLLKQLGLETDPARQLPIFRFLAWHSRDPLVLTMCRAMATKAGVGKQDAYLAAAALLAAGEPGDVFDVLAARFASEDAGKEVFLARAAAPAADTKAAYWAKYLELAAPPEQWTQDSLPWFHWPGQSELTLPYLAKALERVDWVKQNRRIFFMPAWLDAFVNGHSSPAALAIVDEFVSTHTLSTDVRQKLEQSRDGLVRAVRIRAAFAGR